MKKENRFLNTLKHNMICTIVAIMALIVFVWSCGGDLIGGLITAATAVIVAACVYILIKEYKNTPVATPKKTSTKKKSK